MVRLALDAGGGLRIDARGRAPGRGAYLCADPECWRRAARGRSLGAALRRELGEDAQALLEAGPPADRAALAGAGARYASAGETTP